MENWKVRCWLYTCGVHDSLLRYQHFRKHYKPSKTDSRAWVIPLMLYKYFPCFKTNRLNFHYISSIPIWMTIKHCGWLYWCVGSKWRDYAIVFLIRLASTIRKICIMECSHSIECTFGFTCLCRLSDTEKVQLVKPICFPVFHVTPKKQYIKGRVRQVHVKGKI